MNLDKVKDRIRKLLAIANDDSSADGEISAAMKLAEEALEKYHLDRADVESHATTEKPHTETHIVENCTFHGKRMTAWESRLWVAVKKLVGSVGAYSAKKIVPNGTFKVPEKREVLCWYGPAEDVAIATSLFAEWRHVIATLAIAKFRGFARNNGARYALGFAESLVDKAGEADQNRRKLITNATTAIVHCTFGNLGQVLDRKREAATEWLRKEQGVRPTRGSIRRCSITSNNYDAYEAGRTDGRNANFSVTQSKKLTH